jgi:hypothetical protein
MSARTGGLFVHTYAPQPDLQNLSTFQFRRVSRHWRAYQFISCSLHHELLKIDGEIAAPPDLKSYYLRVLRKDRRSTI